MTSVLHVLDSSGDTVLSWDPTSSEQVAEARKLVEKLRALGYGFFRVDGSPAPEEIDAGIAVLSCRPVTAEEVVQPRRRPGRARKAASSEPAPAEPQATTTVATRPLRGG